MYSLITWVLDWSKDRPGLRSGKATETAVSGSKKNPSPSNGGPTGPIGPVREVAEEGVAPPDTGLGGCDSSVTVTSRPPSGYWPDFIPGYGQKSIELFSRCESYGRGTRVRYGERALCAPCANQLACESASFEHSGDGAGVAGRAGEELQPAANVQWLDGEEEPGDAGLRGQPEGELRRVKSRQSHGGRGWINMEFGSRTGCGREGGILQCKN
jgi:hypothetical protein